MVRRKSQQEANQSIARSQCGQELAIPNSLTMMGLWEPEAQEVRSPSDDAPLSWSSTLRGLLPRDGRPCGFLSIPARGPHAFRAEGSRGYCMLRLVRTTRVREGQAASQKVLTLARWLGRVALALRLARFPRPAPRGIPARFYLQPGFAFQNTKR
jgi:hypothetical protein